MTEHIIFGIALAIIGIDVVFTILYPAATIEAIIKLWLPGWHLVKNRKKAKKRAKKEARSIAHEVKPRTSSSINNGEVFP